VSGQRICKLTGLRRGELDLLIGGPPCQGFSILGSRVVLDPRNDLFREFLRVAHELRPRALVMENVPGMATLANGKILGHVVHGFAESGYRVSFAELLAAQYGAPQMRWRMIFIAFRSDLEVPPNMGFPRPTHGHRYIGDLVPNCKIPAHDLDGFVTTREAIGDLPPTTTGKEEREYRGSPTLRYQKQMRAGAGPELHNHYAPRLSKQNLARIAALEAGQDWRDLPVELLPDGMKKAKRKDHTRRYSRMTWEGVPRPIITRFRDPKSGEYIHPEQDRTISIREAARIQSFPDRFVFEGSYSEQYDQVGNAVPAILAEAIGREISSCLRGEATHQLRNPFSRRRLLAQTSLPLDAF
jgi:DNA (cytosine-5)-methyltransferase 1